MLVRDCIQCPEKRHMTSLNSTLIEVFTTIKEKYFVQYSPPMMLLSHTRTFKNFFLFHKDKRHDTDGCFTLKIKIKRMIAKGYLKQFVKGHVYMECDREEPN
jgi:hypothetical protein